MVCTLVDVFVRVVLAHGNDYVKCKALGEDRSPLRIEHRIELNLRAGSEITQARRVVSQRRPRCTEGGIYRRQRNNRIPAKVSAHTDRGWRDVTDLIQQDRGLDAGIVKDSHILTLIITNRRRSTLSQVYKMSPAGWPGKPVEKTGYPKIDSGWLPERLKLIRNVPSESFLFVIIDICVGREPSKPRADSVARSGILQFMVNQPFGASTKTAIGLAGLRENSCAYVYEQSLRAVTYRMLNHVVLPQLLIYLHKAGASLPNEQVPPKNLHQTISHR